jgi:hypothetical protein
MLLRKNENDILYMTQKKQSKNRAISSVKKIIEERVESITGDQLTVYNQAHELVMQAFHACMVRDVIKEYRYQRAEKVRSYNAINTLSHVALENYALLQLWKLFDQKNSVFHVWYAVQHLPHKNLQVWLDEQIKLIEKDINNLSAWRHGFVGHRSEIAHFAPEEFEEKFKDTRGGEDRIKSFLLFLLCQMKFEIYRIEIHKTMEGLSLELRGYAEFLQKEKNEVLKQYE